MSTLFEVPRPANEPVRNYEPSSRERANLEGTLKSVTGSSHDIPCWINGKEVRTEKKVNLTMPHAHRETLGQASLASSSDLTHAIEGALKAKKEWERTSPRDRIAISLKAADLLATRYRDEVNATTMLGQSKSVHQAEIDAACEWIDFLRFNASYYQEILREQPLSGPGMWNELEYRPLEGFVTAIGPFNFTSIAVNLAFTPVLAGNVAIWKPATTQILSAWTCLKVLREAGVPDGVIQFVPCSGSEFGKVAFAHSELAGVHFTGSTETFRSIYQATAGQLSKYRSYPRLVGETGGKDFVFAHPSADVAALSTALLRGAFEYQGQKCSAASRAYLPRSIWPKLKERLVAAVQTIKMGDVRDFSNFMNAVIDAPSFDRITGFVARAQREGAKVLVGGGASKETGYFIEPTILEASDPKAVTMVEELFGPVLTVFVYDDARWEEALTLCDETSPYALTGAIFAQDRLAVAQMRERLRHSAGNFYINDKPTGAVVGQQPFGGARASGTNDKAGSKLNLLRWISPRTIKETFVPPTDYRYPFMG